MPAITRAEVDHLARLARIAMTDAELEKLAGDLDVIVGSIAKVAEVAQSDVPATSHPIPMTNVFREDIVESTLPVADALAGAPASEDNKFLVPQILGEEQ
ncbi:Asp-tRNA(Asn)/Glu-tRNA(Gln) amidotransferase subunit GatC [Saxibacter everestensis]|uniref:Aspartyl/glutamyl-tRNA(Asn/Gln) amidotransferase subunit C n=1 Tax=Saxibacter everestensis TaxID=2909229 RepID=A0ABY8QX90_9MICO|nr:Asp-tRNA(Asn)/Glu-tRNA(Gln) amidotransferase subunit GatC [Brevibacteriaceae bacterium ZFBP1038]